MTPPASYPRWTLGRSLQGVEIQIASRTMETTALTSREKSVNPGGASISNRKFELFQYRHIIYCMRMGQSDRAIVVAKLMVRLKCAELRSIADERGWLGSGPLLDDAELAEVFEKTLCCNATRRP